MASREHDLSVSGSSANLNFYSCQVETPPSTADISDVTPDDQFRLHSLPAILGQESTTPTFECNPDIQFEVPREDESQSLGPSVRRRGFNRGTSSTGSSTHPRLEGAADTDGAERYFIERGLSYELARDLNYHVVNVPKPDNALEANRMVNNYMFGFKKWKSHVSQRPLSERSQTVQQLYQEEAEVPTVSHESVSTCRPGNVVYVLFIGWWLCLVYLVLALLMTITIIGFPYSKFCLKLALYYLWPFGKFILKDIPSSHKPTPPVANGTPTVILDDVGEYEENGEVHSEDSPLLGSENTPTGNLTSTNTASAPRIKPTKTTCCASEGCSYWARPSTYIWLLLGLPVLSIVHSLAFLLTWLTVVFIPAAKLNLRAIQKLLLLSPELLVISNKSIHADRTYRDVIMYTHRAVNINYYKYTVSGVNVIVINGLSIVVLTIVAGYADEQGKVFSTNLKFGFSLVSIMPLAYIISMAITSISAQSSYAIGAVMNATFGSVVEIVLYVTALTKGKTDGKPVCFTELVKSGLVGTLLGTTMLIPGLAMVIGSVKYHAGQRFNPHAAGVTATLLFVSVAGIFAPSVFARAYGYMACANCQQVNTTSNITHNVSSGIECSQCSYEVIGPRGEDSFYHKHVAPLVYTCVLILPLAYIVGLVYSLRTHRKAVYDNFVAEIEDQAETGHGHGAQWGRIKSSIILLVAIVLISLCADVLTTNITPLLGSGISVYFVGATLVALATEIPEIVVGIQFALQNQISLSIEVGNCTAVQVCMLQIPLLVLANLIHPLGFYLVFNDIHIWAVIIGVLLMNYVFQDGKANYFQGVCLVLTWCLLLAMYFFAPDPPGLDCSDKAPA